MEKISKEAREILDKWSKVSDHVTMHDMFEFCETYGISESKIYEFYGIDYKKLSDARDELVRSL